ncbi:MAG: hypothetical protein COV35_08030 [Alphaproteobacteria bacterium CG11_big_fil_rev_8_21_14_0_20_39_49]|nr:MAG: hypothetical protein COV35_08030 [Alphaproteobacteria bacterium CG11_big_fil_rev_8_21_14_0_20_39_49]
MKYSKKNFGNSSNRSSKDDISEYEYSSSSDCIADIDLVEEPSFFSDLSVEEELERLAPVRKEYGRHSKDKKQKHSKATSKDDYSKVPYSTRASKAKTKNSLTPSLKESFSPDYKGYYADIEISESNETRKRTPFYRMQEEEKKEDYRSEYIIKNSYINEETASPKIRRSKRTLLRNNVSGSRSTDSEPSLAGEDEQQILKTRSNRGLISKKAREQGLIVKQFENNAKAVEAIYDTSSDSDNALEPFKETREYSKIKRREEHKQDLISIAKQAFPPDEETRKLYTDSIRNREVDRHNRLSNGYSRNTINSYKAIGSHAKRTTIMHNSLLRKSFKEAIPLEQAISSDIEQYNQSQGEIRTQLLGVIRQDALKMHWKEHEFEDPKIWKVVNFLQNSLMSGDSSKTKISEAIKNDEPLTDCSPFAAWHHIAYKASKNEEGHHFVSVYSLRPDGLMLVHDTRDQKSGEVTSDQWGEHEWIHRATGMSDTQRFSQMDEKAINILLEKTLVPKTTKREKYALNIIERLDNYVKNIAPDNEEAFKLNEDISRLNRASNAKDVDKFLSGKLKDYDWGQALLKQQEVMDKRTLLARNQVSQSSSTHMRF